MTTKERRIQANFQLDDSNEEFCVYRRAVKTQGRTSKEIRRIEDELPKTTIYYISDEEYEKLKQIETDLIEEIFSTRRKRRMSLRDVLRDFLEL